MKTVSRFLALFATLAALVSPATGTGATGLEDLPGDIAANGLTIQLAPGGYHTCVLTDIGGVRCWGDNSRGQLGDGENTVQTSLPVTVKWLLRGSTAIAAGFYHTCAVAAGGGVKCWGYNYDGQLGNGSTTKSPIPVDVSGLAGGVASIAAGDYHVCARTDGGGVKCWGDNLYGQLGNNSTTDSSTPVNVSGLGSGVATVVAGRAHTCALTTNGGVKCWGENWMGQLGTGNFDDSDIPVDVPGLTSGVSAITAGGDHTCAVTDGGGVKCWGKNGDGEVGDGTTESWRLSPVDVSGLTTGASAVAAGSYHTCAVTDGGGLKCWGRNAMGQIGDGSVDSRLAPVNVSGPTSGVDAVWAGYEHTCAVTDDGDALCWGRNVTGQVGDDTVWPRWTPMSVAEQSSGISLVDAGHEHTCAVGSGGSLNCWGSNMSGQVGNGGSVGRSFEYTPTAVSGMSNASRVSAGGWNSAYGHTCAVTSAGGIRCWGENQNGQLGNGGTVDSTTPVTVTGLSGLVNVVAAGGEHTCASTTGGAAQCWGDNVSGQLGDSTKNDSSTPVNVSGLSSGVTAIATGFRHTCAVVGGAVRCWGRNQYGQLGNAGTTESSAPVSVSGISNGATVVAAGAEHSCAVVSGGAKCWGYGGSGQLGNGDTTNSSVPVDVSGLGAVSAISVGDHHTCALTTGGGVKCWGENGYGQLGNGDDADSSTPVDVTGLTSGVTAITAGGDHTCAVTGGGAVKCWGYNSFSQIGDGAIVYHTEPQELTINVYPTLFAPVVLTDR